MDKTKLGLDKLTDDELVDLIVSHGQKMTGNTNFPTPSPSAVDFTAATGPYVDQVGVVNGLEIELKEAIILRNRLRPVAANAMTLRGSYVDTASGGRGEIILTSGLPLAAKPGPAAGGEGSYGPPPATAESLAVTMGDMPGTQDAMWHYRRGTAWIVQICNDPQQESGFRQVLVTNRSSCTITGLTSGQKYWVRVAPVRGGVQGPWCNAVPCLAP